MDLFVINRFTGEDPADEKTEENNKLDKLLEKINKSKKKKLELINKENTDQLCVQESELFKKVTNEPVSTTNIKGAHEPVSNIEENESDEDEPQVKKSKIPDPINIDGFTILGTTSFDKRRAIKRVLPTWIRNPTVFSTDLQNSSVKVSRTDIDKKLKERLKENKIKYLYPVQAEFIPWQTRISKQSNVIHPPDACISAPTGSGKTLAFAIPLLQHLTDKLKNRNMTIKAVRALLVLPTQSLAVQTYDVFKVYSADTGIVVGILTSGETTFKNEQKLLITNNSVWGSYSKCDIIVCTAGRLIDHLKSTKGFELQHLEYIIIDEADRVLDSMQDDWLRTLGMHMRSEGNNFIGSNVLTVSSIKKRTDPQKLLFSATLSSDPEKLEKLSLFQPKLFTCVTNNEMLTRNTEGNEESIGKYTLPNELIENYIICNASNKPLILYKLIMDIVKNTKSAKIIVFVNESATGHRLSTLMCYMARKNFIIKEISNRTNKQLLKELLESFSSGQTNVIICTNLIARGINIPNVNCVISYEAPTQMASYVHRAGRTARCGVKGECVTMLEEYQKRKFLTMLKNASRTTSLEEIHHNENELESLSILYRKSLEKMKFKIRSQEKHALFKTKMKKQVFNDGKNKFRKNTK